MSWYSIVFRICVILCYSGCVLCGCWVYCVCVCVTSFWLGLRGGGGLLLW